MPPQTARRGPGRPPAAKAADTRERIMQAARDVFSELGYDAATFQAIAARADLTRPAINHYFASKRVLWAEVVEETNAIVAGAGISRARSKAKFLDRLSVFFSAVMSADSGNHSAAAFLVTSVLESQRHPELATGEHDLLRSSREFISWAVNDAIARGELTTDIEVNHLVEMLLAAMWGMGIYAGFVGSRAGLESVVHTFEDLMSSGLYDLHD